MIKEWKPAMKDFVWTDTIINSLGIGGVWGTSFGTFKRTAEKELTLILDDSLIPIDEKIKKDNQDRVKKCVEALGWKYID